MIVDHLGITVDDLPRASAQFGAVLGALGFARSDGDGAVFWWRAGEPELILYAPREHGAHVHGRVGWQHLALEVGSRSEVDRIHGVAVAAGWAVVREPKLYPRFSDRYYASFVEDAAGIRLELMHNLDHDVDLTLPRTAGAIHHVELRTADLASATAPWAWLLGELGYTPFQEWPAGRSWRKGDTYIVVESAPSEGAHDRRMPGLSHVAFHAGSRDVVDRLWERAGEHGWARLYADRHPFAGGEAHYAAFLENAERFKIELVAEA